MGHCVLVVGAAAAAAREGDCVTRAAKTIMLVYGTANPEGYGDANYAGLYLTDEDIDRITPQMVGVPVKIEHRGADVGRVVSAWKHQGRMDLILELPDYSAADGNNNNNNNDGDSAKSVLENLFGKEFVRRGMCKDLSLGYKVEMSQGSNGQYRAVNKKVVEVSLVRVGARENCHIRGWSDNNAQHHHPQVGSNSKCHRIVLD